uniref:Phosphatidylinositol-specific phospholipase C X domain-containing protein n=1 Tax=Amphiprion percula TaxID=161767 RepID=A0A3P8U1D9_AMPPE
MTSCAGSGPGFNDGPALDPKFYNMDWMKSIPDETPLSAISIPGTHESLSLYGGPLVVCQVWTLDKQLKVGIRYFDVHVGIWFRTQKDIYIRDSHWMFDQHIHFNEVLRVILNFLDLHSGETVLLKVTFHGFYQEKTKQLMKKLTDRFQSRIWTRLSVPNMQQARGKIVFLQSESVYIGTENQKSYFFENNKLINVEGKIKLIKPHLCDHHMVLTETAASALRGPKSLARTVNKQLSDLVVQHQRSSLNRGCLGVLSMSFPSADLIQNIIHIQRCDCESPTSGEVSEPTPEPPPEPESATSGEVSEPPPEPESPTSEEV